jgi:hypothetical protein
VSERERVEAELGRASAETERERREDLRRIGEGGPEQHVPGHVTNEQGRVEAEEGRVAAEEKRADVRHFYTKLAASIALPLAFIALIPALVGIWMVDNETDERIAANRQHIQELNMLAENGVEAHDALCAFKVDLEGRAESTSLFIFEIENDIRPPISGISIADLRRTLSGQRATLNALSTLDCP